MGDINDILGEQQRELERIRNRRHRSTDTTTVRKLLNVAFLLLALAGLVLYFFLPERQHLGWLLIAVGMGLKVVEFFLRFLF